jgi:hypothetical protein
LYKKLSCIHKKHRKNTENTKTINEGKNKDSENTNIGLEFLINKKGDIDIGFLWKDISLKDDYLSVKEDADNLAALVSLVSNGGFKNDLIKILLESHKNNTEANQIFINMILENLVRLEASKNNISNKPVILPSQAFKKYEQR